MKRLLVIIAAVVLLANLEVSAVTKRALVIGIGPYPAESGWAKINGDKDIPVIVEMLQINGFKGQNIYTLANEKATKANIKGAMKRLADRCKPGDHVYIHFSGHGQQVPDLHGDETEGLDEAWIPYDAKARYEDNGDYKGQNHIIDDELYIWYSAIADRIGNKGHLTISVDACHSGDCTRGTVSDTVCVRGWFSDGTRGFDTTFEKICNLLSKDEMPKGKRPIRWVELSACKPGQDNREFRGCGSLTTALRLYADQLGKMTAEQVRMKVLQWIHSNVSNQSPFVQDETKNNPFL